MHVCMLFLLLPQGARGFKGDLGDVGPIGETGETVKFCSGFTWGKGLFCYYS